MPLGAQARCFFEAWGIQEPCLPNSKTYWLFVGNEAVRYLVSLNPKPLTLNSLMDPMGYHFPHSPEPEGKGA